MDPKYNPFTLCNDSISDKVGFDNEEDMLAYIILVCNGDFDVMIKTESRLLWYKEWFFYFDSVWGRRERCRNRTTMERFGIPNKETM